MTPRERVRAALAHCQPDFTPCDYFATPGDPAGPAGLLRVDSRRREAALRRASAPSASNSPCGALGTDIRYIRPPYVGPPLRTFDDGSTMNIWGIRRRPMPNQYGEYAEPVGTPYAAWKTVEEADRFPWPSPDWFDYEAIPALCAAVPRHGDRRGRFSVQDFINSVAFGRGVEQVLIDIAEGRPGLPVHRRETSPVLPALHRADPGGRPGRIDLVLCGDDFGSQRGR